MSKRMAEEPAAGTRRFALDVGERVLVRGLQTQTELNFSEGVLAGYDKEKKRCEVALAGGREVLVKLENLLFYAQWGSHVAKPAAALADLARVERGAKGRAAVAVGKIRAGTMSRTDSAVVCLSPAEIDEVRGEFAYFLEFLDETAGMELALPATLPYYSQFQEDTAGMEPALPATLRSASAWTNEFVGVFFEKLWHEPMIQELMGYDAFSPGCLWLEMRRCTPQDLLWFFFWMFQLRETHSATDVWRGFVFLKSHAQGDGLSVLFGSLISTASCPEERWEHYEGILRGEWEEDAFQEKNLGNFVMVTESAGVGETWVLFIRDVEAGGQLELDYGIGYVRGKVGLRECGKLAQGEYWYALFRDIVKGVHPAVGEALEAYLGGTD